MTAVSAKDPRLNVVQTVDASAPCQPKNPNQGGACPAKSVELDLPLGNFTYSSVTVVATDNMSPPQTATATLTTSPFPYTTPVSSGGLQAPTNLSAVAGNTTADGKHVAMMVNFNASVDRNVGAQVGYTVTAISSDGNQDVSTTLPPSAPCITAKGKSSKGCTQLSTELDLPLGHVVYSEVKVMATDNMSPPQMATAELTTAPFPYTTGLLNLPQPTINQVMTGTQTANSVPMLVNWTPAPDNNVGAVMNYTVTAVSDDGTNNISETSPTPVAPCVSVCQPQTTTLNLPLGGIHYTQVTVTEQDSFSLQAQASYSYDYTTPVASDTGTLSTPTGGTAKLDPTLGSEIMTWGGSYFIDSTTGNKVYATSYSIEVVGGNFNGKVYPEPCTSDGSSQVACYSANVPGYGTSYIVTGHYTQNGLNLTSPPLTIVAQVSG